MSRLLLFVMIFFWPGLALSADLAPHIHGASAWTRATAPTAAYGAAYLQLENRTGQDDVLLSVSSPAARKIEIHESKRNDLGVFTMNRIDRLPLKNGDTVTLAPGGLHLMLVGLKAPLVVGQEIALRLEFAHSLPINLRAEIKPVQYQPGEVVPRAEE